jgi:hypothetical protein
MLDLRGGQTTWPDELKPIGEGETFDKEPFAAWWGRCAHLLPGIPPLAAEQWIHRHWSHSPYFGIPLQPLRGWIETWTADQILSQVYIGETLHPAWTYKQLKDHHTGRTMIERGAWDYPLLVMATPQGFKDWAGRHPRRRSCLIEGHQRFRFLNALAQRGEAAPHYDVLVLAYDPALSKAGLVRGTLIEPSDHPRASGASG